MVWCQGGVGIEWRIKLGIEWELEIDLTMFYLYKIQNNQEYFLYEVEDQATLWTADFDKAISFISEEAVENFKEEYLPRRNDVNIMKR